MSELIVYGVELSQPCRTVTWLLRNHGVPFKLQPTNPGSNKPNGSRSEKYLDELYIAGTVPVLKDGDVVVPESHAIIVYLAEKFGWDEVFPTGKGNEAKRAEINRWLHWHHGNSRAFSGRYFAPIFRTDIKQIPEVVAQNTKICNNAAKSLDKHLSRHPFLAIGSTAPTLADFAVFADLGQLYDLELFDWSGFKNVLRWMAEMRKLKGYEESHALIGKVARPMVEKWKKAQGAKM